MPTWLAAGSRPCCRRRRATVSTTRPSSSPPDRCPPSADDPGADRRSPEPSPRAVRRARAGRRPAVLDRERHRRAARRHRTGRRRCLAGRCGRAGAAARRGLAVGGLAPSPGAVPGGRRGVRTPAAGAAASPAPGYRSGCPCRAAVVGLRHCRRRRAGERLVVGHHLWMTTPTGTAARINEILILRSLLRESVGYQPIKYVRAKADELNAEESQLIEALAR